MRKSFVWLGIALASLLTLTGCQTIDASTSFVLKSTDSVSPRALSSLEEQEFYSTEIADSFGEWLIGTGWTESYPVSDYPLTWIPKKQDEAFADSISKEKCAAWIEFKSGEIPASTTSSYIYRVLDSEKNVATSLQMVEIFDHLSSDLQRRGWELSEDSGIGSSTGNVKQLSWFVPTVEGKDYKPVDSYVSAVSGKPETGYLGYRLTVSDKGDGYIAFYTSSPCAPIESEQYDQLQGDTGSTELDLIDSDAKNPDNGLLKP